jgi:hypothetical protein
MAIRSPRRRAVRAPIVLLTLMLAGPSGSEPAGSALTTLDNPGGGEVVYGLVEGEASLPAAMASLLRSVHEHFGNRPEIGKLFRTRGTDSLAAFFAVTANPGGQPFSGLAIVSMRTGLMPSGAVLFDRADRFARTEPVLMVKLNTAWQQQAVRPSAKPAQPLHTATASDGSASVGLPSGWQISGGGGGSLHAAGPNGESVHLGVINQNIYDARNPRAQGMIQYLSRGRTPFSVCPFGDDLVNSFLCVSKQTRERQGLQPVTLAVINRIDAPATQYEVHVQIVSAEMDFHDGKGAMMASIRLGAMPMGPSGAWALTVSSELVPKRLAEDEWPTMAAVAASYRQNGQVIAGQTAQVIADIHTRAAANDKLIAARSAANDAHNAAVDTRWDEQAKQNKVFENYTLDRSVVQDNQENARGTIGYAAAESLIQADPNRFQYVPNQELLKGRDF